MKESYVEGLASYGGPESCVHIREGVGEALTGERAGRVSSRVIHAPRLRSREVRGAGGGGGPGCRGGGDVAKATPGLPHWQGSPGPRAVTDPAHARKHFAREPGDPASFWGTPGGESRTRAHREARGRTTMSQGRGKSDRGVVPKKPVNKAAGAIPAAAESVEGRPRAKGNANAAHTRRTPSRPYDVHSALDGIRQTAKGDRQARFTTQMHHVHAVERLQDAYFALKRDAAAGVDGMTWHTYGQDLAHNLQ